MLHILPFGILASFSYPVNPVQPDQGIVTKRFFGIFRTKGTSITPVEQNFLRIYFFHVVTFVASIRINQYLFN